MMKCDIIPVSYTHLDVYKRQVLDCLGCGSCANVCPAKEKALTMVPIGTQMGEAENWDYSIALSPKANPMNPETVKAASLNSHCLS